MRFKEGKIVLFWYLLCFPSSGSSMEYNNISICISINCSHLTKPLISWIVSMPMFVLFKPKGWFTVNTVRLTTWNSIQRLDVVRFYSTWLFCAACTLLYSCWVQITLCVCVCHFTVTLHRSLAATCDHGRPSRLCCVSSECRKQFAFSSALLRYSPWLVNTCTTQIK